MVSVKNVEAYLLYEVVVLVEVCVNRILGREDNPYQLEQQWNILKRAFHLFMLDIEADDFKRLYSFKDLKLPSENRSKKAKPSNKKSKHKETKVGKQLQLFFISSINNFDQFQLKSAKLYSGIRRFKR